MKFLTTLRNLRASFSPYHPLIEILIFRDRIVHNLNTYQQKFPHLQFAPVLKSNAYGHGLIEVGKILNNQKVPFLVVDSLFEALRLRNEGIRTKILIIGYVNAKSINSCRLPNIAFAITSLEQLHEIAHTLKKKRVFHLKIDTGMHRQGILPSELQDALEMMRGHACIELEGICSHLADSDGIDPAFTRTQVEVWKTAVDTCKKTFPSLRYVHIAATAGTHYAPEMPGNVARLGFGLYGFNPSPFEDIDLKPSLMMRSVISSVRKLSRGEHVGYAATYETTSDTLTATVPAGYFEGVDRRLSSKGSLMVKGRACRIIGRVSMNITSIDVTNVPEIKLDDEVIVISNEHADPNSARTIAQLTGTIPYEILVHIPQHLRRTVV